MKTELLVVLISTGFCLPACNADTIPPFGAASAYNLVALGGANKNGTTLPGNVSTAADVGGRVAAAGVVLSGTTVGSDLGADPWKTSAPFDLISTGGFNPGEQFNLNSTGNAYAPGSNGGINFNGGGHRVTTGGSGVDFAALKTSLGNESYALSQLATTGSVGAVQGSNPSWLVLYGTSTILNVFDITAAEFASTNNNLDIQAPLGSTIIVNVAGTDVVLGGGLYYNGVQHAGDDPTDDDILFNFYGANTVGIDAQFNASVLAPFATLSGTGQMSGNFIAAQIGQTGEVHDGAFTGTLPPTDPTAVTPEPTSLVLLGTGALSTLAALRRRRFN